MAFASELTDRSALGNLRVHFGTFANTGGGTGGDIDTKLRSCIHLQLTLERATVLTGECVVNESLPVAGKAVTIVTDADVDGVWMAVGY